MGPYGPFWALWALMGPFGPYGPLLLFPIFLAVYLSIYDSLREAPRNLANRFFDDGDFLTLDWDALI